MITEERLAETLRCLQDMQKDDRLRFYYPFLDGVQEVIRTLRAENEGLKERVRELEARPAIPEHIQWALNSGTGVYKP